MTATPAKKELFAMLPAKDGAGKDIFSVLVKRTYDIRPGAKATRAEKDVPLIPTDKYYDDGDPEWASVQYESDLTPFKPGADLVVIARVHAPGGKPGTVVDASVKLGERTKTVRVIGDRTCRFRDRAAPLFTDPIPFLEMPLRYELAYGGTDSASVKDMPFSYPRNHIGRGLAIKNLKHVVDGLALPNIEDPGDLLTPERVVLGEMDKWNGQPLPAGVGWFQKTWYPRCSYVGAVPAYISVEDVPREAKYGLVPANQIELARRMKLPAYDARFGNGASLGLIFPELTGSETIELTNMTADGRLRFALPGDAPRIALDMGAGAVALPAILQTVCVRVDEMQVDLVWRGTQTYPGHVWLPNLKKLEAEVM